MKRYILALIVGALSIPLVAAPSVADDEEEPSNLQADDLAATVTFTHVQGLSRTCQGQDGFYFQNRFTFTGTSTGDARLTGAIEYTEHELFNGTQNTGPQQGTVVIRDSRTGKKKAEGIVNNWGPADFTQGTIFGRVQDTGGGAEPTTGAGTLIANWRVTYHLNGAVSAQIGGVTTDNRIPAGLWTGTCSGKYTSIDEVLPAPSALTLLGSATNWRAPLR